MVLRRNIYRGVYHQRGNGVGAILSGLFRLLTPFIRRGAKAALKSAPVKAALKSAKRSAVKTVGYAAKDILSGKSPKANAKLNLKEAQAGIERALLTSSSSTRQKKRSKGIAPKQYSPSLKNVRKVKRKKIETNSLLT